MLVQPGSTMETISTKIDPTTKKALDKLIAQGEYSNFSEILRIALLEFLKTKNVRWQSRKEMRTYFEGRSEVPCDEILTQDFEEDEL